MRRRVPAMIAALSIACSPFVPGPALAQQDSPAETEAYPVELASGGSFDVCASSQVVCPARTAICDDPKVAVPVDLPGGLGFRAASPGSTLCSAASAIGPRRVFRITVR